MSRSSIIIELDDDVYEKIKGKAKKNLRSARKEIEFILIQAVQDESLPEDLPTTPEDVI